MAGAKKVDAVHINRLLAESRLLNDYQILCIPGGFCYGDDIGAGKILASKLSRNLGDILHLFCDSDKLILGICNGFQVLLKSGLLLSDTSGEPIATLAWNDSAVYTDKWIHLQSNDTKCVFLNGIKELYLPIAHAEGRFVPKGEPSVLANLNNSGQLALRYKENENPNGSIADVAGVCDSSGRIFGLMPHPERFIDIFQHPHWTRIIENEKYKEKNNGGGLKIFQNAISYFS
jgi:phosphoribosylformylglycinamidine synthase